MNKEEMDVVEFAEMVLVFELFDYQKEILRTIRTEMEAGKIIYFAPVRHSDLRNLFSTMRTIMGLYYQLYGTVNSIPETINKYPDWIDKLNVTSRRKDDKDECKEM